MIPIAAGKRQIPRKTSPPEPSGGRKQKMPPVAGGGFFFEQSARRIGELTRRTADTHTLTHNSGGKVAASIGGILSAAGVSMTSFGIGGRFLQVVDVALCGLTGGGRTARVESLAGRAESKMD